MRKGFLRAGTIGAVALLLAAGVLMGLLSLLEERLVFHPSRRVEATPDLAGLAWEDLRLRTADGETIAAWHVPAPGGVPAILFLHGNAGNLGHRIRSLAGLHDAGFSVVILDYRGYGESTGTPSEAGLYADARAGWEHLTRDAKLPPSDILLYGESIGSAPALNLALDLQRAGAEGPAAVVVEGAFTSAAEMGRRVFPFLPVRWIQRSRFDNLAAARELRTPTLVLHGGDDEIVPVEMGRRLYEESAAPLKELHLFAGATHNTVWARSGRDLVRIVREFAAKAAPRP